MVRESQHTAVGAWAPRLAESASPPAAKSAEPIGSAGAVDWQRLWLATQRSEWRSLALIPIGEGISTERIAIALAEVGRLHLGGTVIAHDATRVSISSLRGELSLLAERAGCSHRAIVALPPLVESPAALALAQAADALILCIALGKSAIAEARKVVAEVGPERVLGSVIVRERKGNQ